MNHCPVCHQPTPQPLYTQPLANNGAAEMPPNVYLPDSTGTQWRPSIVGMYPTPGCAGGAAPVIFNAAIY